MKLLLVLGIALLQTEVTNAQSSATLPQEGMPYVSPASSASSSKSTGFDKTVFPITDLKFVGLGLDAKMGTGFCLDPECRYIGTNYHVAMMTHLRNIKGQRIVKRYLATGPMDENATVNDGPYTGPMKYTLSKDLAIFELGHSVPEYRGVEFSLEELETGQEVDIYAYPKEGLNPFRSLLRFHGKFEGETSTGLLAFDYTLSGDKAIRPGASGGVVVDSKTGRIVGILNAIAHNGEAVALAVPVQSLVDFVSKVQPSLGQRIFPTPTGVPSNSADLYPKLVLPSSGVGLQHRPEESSEIKLLRMKAQLLADSMRDLIAVQSFTWGSGNKQPAALAAYEVRIVDGYQRFRKYPDGKTELEEVPLPFLNNAIIPAKEWSELPNMVGAELGLKIRHTADVLINERLIKVFQYQGDQEDHVCRFETVMDFGFFVASKAITIGCYGEVWTDENTNILRMSEHYELSGRWTEYQAVVTYGWLRRKDEAPRLIPLTISTQANLNKRVYWCHGRFTDYKEFASRVRILSGKSVDGSPAVTLTKLDERVVKPQ
jgi:hypothetical protein